MAVLAVLARVQVVAALAQLPVLAHPVVRAQLPVRALRRVVVVLAHLPVRAHLVVPAQLPVLALRQVDLVLPPSLQVVVVLAHLPVRAQLPVRALRQVEAVLPAVLLAVSAGEVAPQLTRSSSAAMAGTTPSAGPPTYTLAPRSRRKPKRRPCPLA